MLPVIFWMTIFSASTVVSILLTGSRSLIGGDIAPWRLLHILIDWRFIIGAGLAFVARLSFILINNALLKIPHLAQSSATITLFITSITTIFVVIANYYFLGERINVTQGIGAFIIMIGTLLIVR